MEILETGQFTDLRVERGEGCWLWDSEGHRHLDLLAGTWSCVLGHSHPEFSARAAAQLKRLTHVRPGLTTGEIRRACERLAGLSPFGVRNQESASETAFFPKGLHHRV